MAPTSQVPERVFVEVHLGCSHGCQHCYQVGPGLTRDRHLPLAAALERIRQLKRLGVREIVPVTGEVLEHPEYLAAYREAGWTEYLVTSGLRLIGDRRLGALVAAYGFRSLQISAHYGLSDDTPAIPARFCPAGDDQIPKVVEAAARHGLKVEAFCLIGSHNWSDIGRLFRRAMSDGLEALYLINLMPVRPCLSRFCLTADQIKSVFGQVEAIRQSDPEARRRLRLEGNFGPRPGSAVGMELARTGRYCPAGKESVYLAVDGSVYGCHFLLDPKIRLGRFENGRIVLERQLPDFDHRTCYLLCAGCPKPA